MCESLGKTANSVSVSQKNRVLVFSEHAILNGGGGRGVMKITPLSDFIKAVEDKLSPGFPQYQQCHSMVYSQIHPFLLYILETLQQLVGIIKAVEDNHVFPT